MAVKQRSFGLVGAWAGVLALILAGVGLSFDGGCCDYDYPVIAKCPLPDGVTSGTCWGYDKTSCLNTYWYIQQTGYFDTNYSPVTPVILYENGGTAISCYQQYRCMWSNVWGCESFGGPGDDLVNSVYKVQYDWESCSDD